MFWPWWAKEVWAGMPVLRMNGTKSVRTLRSVRGGGLCDSPDLGFGATRVVSRLYVPVRIWFAFEVVASNWFRIDTCVFCGYPMLVCGLPFRSVVVANGCVVEAAAFNNSSSTVCPSRIHPSDRNPLQL